ncbi:MAG: hypothetical protein ACYDAS_04400 [Patescibacteria group bacterium]
MKNFVKVSKKTYVVFVVVLIIFLISPINSFAQQLATQQPVAQQLAIQTPNNTSTFSGALNSTTKSHEGATTSGITVSPLLTTIFLNKTESSTQYITLFNNNSTPITVGLAFSNFISKNQFGAPQFLGFSKGQIQDPNLLIQSPKSITLPPLKTIKVPLTILTNNNTSPGEYFIGAFAVIKGKTLKSAPVSIATSSAIGSLFLIRINGKVNETGFIQSFSATRSLFTGGPVNFQTIFKDTGNVDLIPQGVIDIYNMFGKHVASVTFNKQRSIVLPVGVNSRIYSSSWKPGSLLFGEFTAKLFLTYGTTTVTTIYKSTNFWIIPLWLEILAIIIVILIVTWIVRLRLKLRT